MNDSLDQTRATVKTLEQYETQQKELKQRTQEAIIYAIDAAVNFVVSKSLFSHEFIFGTEGIFEFLQDEKKEYTVGETPIYSYPECVSFSDEELVKIISLLKGNYPASNFNFGEHHLGVTLKLEIHV